MLKQRYNNFVFISFEWGNFWYCKFGQFPWHVLTILLLYKGKIKSLDYSLFLFVGIVLLGTTALNFQYYNNSLFGRQILNYVSIVFGGAYLIANPPNIRNLAKIITIVLLANITLGCLQVFSDIFAVFSNARLLAMRGTVGLFAEPTAFGLFSIFCFLFGWVLLKFNHDKLLLKYSKIIIFLSIFSIIFVNRSSTAMLILLLFFALTSLRSLKGIMLITSFIIVLFSNYYFFPETRAGIILKVLIQNDIFSY